MLLQPKFFTRFLVVVSVILMVVLVGCEISTSGQAVNPDMEEPDMEETCGSSLSSCTTESCIRGVCDSEPCLDTTACSKYPADFTGRCGSTPLPEGKVCCDPIEGEICKNSEECFTYPSGNKDCLEKCVPGTVRTEVGACIDNCLDAMNKCEIRNRPDENCLWEYQQCKNYDPTAGDATTGGAI